MAQTVKVYSVYDVKAMVYGKPFYCKNDGEALRLFGDVSRDKETMIGKHPSDFQLFHLGDFDDVTGSISGIKPRFMILASDTDVK